MKLRKIIIPLITLSFLTSCTITFGPGSAGNSDDLTSFDPTTEETTNSTDNTSKEPTIKPTGSKTFTILGVNDFHGATKYINSSYPQLGLAKLCTVFNDIQETTTTFTISNGDMWQETYESNSNKGAYVTEAMNFIGFDTMGLGNHEFDWGIEPIKNNADLADFPFICSNLRKKSDNKLPDFISPSILLEKDDVKIGVIGSIGVDQYNSISYDLVYEYYFDEQYTHIVEEAEKLRDQGAVAIILNDHSCYKDVKYNDNQLKIINDAKIDYVISGHSHNGYAKSLIRDDGKTCYYSQGYSNGTAFTKIDFTYDYDKDELSSTGVKLLNSKDYKNVTPDQRILDLYDEKYNVDEIIKEEICQVEGNLSPSLEAANLAATVMYNKVRELFPEYDVIGASHNQARDPIYEGLLTYEYLFKAYPFDNEIIIYETTYTDFNSSYGNKNKEWNTSFYGTSKVYACSINYIVFSRRNYPLIEPEDTIRTGLYIRDLIKEFLQEEGTLVASDYNY